MVHTVLFSFLLFLLNCYWLASLGSQHWDGNEYAGPSFGYDLGFNTCGWEGSKNGHRGLLNPPLNWSGRVRLLHLLVSLSSEADASSLGKRPRSRERQVSPLEEISKRGCSRGCQHRSRSWIMRLLFMKKDLNHVSHYCVHHRLPSLDTNTRANTHTPLVT